MGSGDRSGSGLPDPPGSPGLGLFAPLVAAAAGWWLAGLGWTVQATTYPAFADVSPERWVAHHAAHSRRISWAVGPAWVVQGGATVWWLVTDLGALSVVHAFTALTGVLITGFWAVPAHQRLSGGFPPPGTGISCGSTQFGLSCSPRLASWRPWAPPDTPRFSPGVVPSARW